MRTVRYSSPGLKTHRLSGSAAVGIPARNPIIIGCLIAGAIIAACLTFLWLTRTPLSNANIAPVQAFDPRPPARSPQTRIDGRAIRSRQCVPRHRSPSRRRRRRPANAAATDQGRMTFSSAGRSQMPPIVLLSEIKRRRDIFRIYALQ